MSSEEILAYLHATPFRPFQIRMVSGRTFDVRHRELVDVGKRHLVIYKFISSQPDANDEWDTIGLLLIESISHLEPTRV